MNKEIREIVSRVARKGISQRDSTEAYKTWAITYEEDYRKCVYNGPALCAQYLCEQIPENARASAKIMDVGAGTGLVAKELKAVGFKHMDALDGSTNMLEKAKIRDDYDNYFVNYISKDPLPIAENSYDALSGCGIFAEGGHVPVDCLYEMIRLVKPGGFIILATRALLIDSSISDTNKDLEPLMKKLEAEGKWRCVKRDVGKDKFYADIDAVVWLYQKL